MAQAIDRTLSGPISSPKDFWTGVIYVGFGAALLVIGWEYRMGVASRMGPGYFPKVLATILIFIGVLSLFKGFTTRGEPIGRFALVPLALIPLSTVAFGLLLPRLGLVVALAALILMSAVASAKFRLDAKSLALAAALILFCVVVFVAGLGVPMPVFGPWIAPYTDPWTIPLQRNVIDPFVREVLAPFLREVVTPFFRDVVAPAWRAIVDFVSGLFGG